MEPNINADQIKEDAKNKALETLKGMSAAVVNIEDIADAEARKAADAYMTESKDQKKDGWLKRIWKHSFVESFYRQREVGRVTEEIKNSGNIYSRRVSEENSKNADEMARLAIARRFTSEYDDTVILSNGEERKILDNNPENIQVKDSVQNLIAQYATDKTFSREAFNESKTRILNGLKSQDLLKGANTYADNLFEIAQNARLAIEHGAKMDELKFGTDLIIGKAKSSLKTEAHYNKIDKITDAVKNSKIGRYISPAILSTALGIGYSITVGVSKKFARSKLAAYGTLGAAVGVSTIWAGMDKSQRLAGDRGQHGLEMAEGGKYEPGSKKREQMNQYQYEMENSNNLAQRLRDAMFEKDIDGNDIPKDISQQDLDNIFASLADIDARKSLNAKNKIDLISYSNIGSVEKESTDLIILTARAKNELNKKISSGLLNIPTGETMDVFLAKQTRAVENTLLGGENGITKKDKAFGKFRTKEVAKKMVITAAVGFTVGAVVQEGFHFAKDHVVNMFEGAFGWHAGVKVDSQTPLEHFRGWITGHPNHMNMGTPVHLNMNGHEFVLPEGTSIEANPDGTYNIMQGKDIKFDHLPLIFGVNGQLDDASVHMLGDHGIVSTEDCMTVNGTKEVTGNAEDYIKANPDGTTHVSRGVDGVMHYDNDTPKPLFEQNEQKLDWGGTKGLDANGNYIFNMSRMTGGGSFHEQFSVDAQEKMKNGGLKILLSLTQGTQNHVFEIPIDEHGNAIIDPNSEVGKLFFGTVNGHAMFKGRFAEVAETFGTKDGIEHVRVLATYEGPGNDIINHIVPVPIDVPVTDLALPLDTEPPMYIPFFINKPLESVTYKENVPTYGYNSYNEKRKGGYTNIKQYRNTEAQDEELINNIPTNPVLKGKYEFMVERLKILKNYKNLPPDIQEKIKKQAFIYNNRYNGPAANNKHISVEKFVEKEIQRLYSQTENIYIENFKVGEKPYSKSFYENAPLIKGLERCKEVVVILDDPLGDGTLTLPVINSINKYFELNGINKKIKVISKKFSKLYKPLEDQFPNVEVLSLAESEKYFEKNKKDLFVFNTNGNFDDYEMLNITEEESKDISRVMSVDWNSWTKEETPIDEHSMTKYDPLPSRIARNLEIMVGQKLFENIKDTEKYLEKSKKFEKESKEIKKKYKIKDKEELIVISVGSSASPKEYSPDKWREVINGIFAKNPNTHILVLNDPDTAKRAKYAVMFNDLISKNKYKISHADEGLDKMNTIMSMADVVITPDTGLGHYAGALGRKAVMLYLTDPVLWSTPGARRVVHPKGYETYKKGIGLDSRLWAGTNHYNNNEYYVEDNGVGIGASEIESSKVLDKIYEGK